MRPQINSKEQIEMKQLGPQSHVEDAALINSLIIHLH